MIRELLKEDIQEANKLLSSLNYQISENTFDNVFFKSLVYYENGIRGIIIYSLIYDRIEIEYIVVENQYRRKGIATKLFKTLENNNVNNITLEVRKSNLSAIKFYKENGFEIETIRKNYYKNEDGYLMIKELKK